MPAVVGDQIWFRDESETRPNPNPCHAIIEGEPEALCGQRIVYYRAETMRFLPEGAVIHEECAEALKKRNG